MRLIAAAFVVLMFVATARSAEPGIADVETLAELAACEPHDVGGGWTVRLGYADPGDEAVPWVTLYCLGDDSGAAARVERADGPGELGDPLGPVYYAWAPKGTVVRHIERLKRVRRAGRWLFCVTLQPVAGATMTLTVRDAGGRVLRARDFKPRAEAGPPWRWHTFARHGRGARDAEVEMVVADGAVAARPVYGDLFFPPEAVDADAPPPPLPGATAAGEADGIKLSLEGAAFVLAARRPMSAQMPEHLLLARWWVNGEPVAPPSAERGAAQAQQRQAKADESEEFKVGFGLPDHLGKLKAGDRVALQVLYSADGYERVNQAAAASTQQMQRLERWGRAARPLLSNRLEFELTEALLRQADHAPPAE